MTRIIQKIRRLIICTWSGCSRLLGEPPAEEGRWLAG